MACAPLGGRRKLEKFDVRYARALSEELHAMTFSIKKSVSYRANVQATQERPLASPRVERARSRRAGRTRMGLVTPAVPAVPAGLRAAIVTLWDGEAAFACAVMHWCDHAERLAHVFRQYLGARTDIAAVLTTSRGDDVLKSDCPQLQIIRPDAALVAAVKRFSTVGCKGRWAGGLQALSHSHSLTDPLTRSLAHSPAPSFCRTCTSGSCSAWSSIS